MLSLIKKKAVQFLVISSFLVIGMGTASMFNATPVNASGDCAFLVCDEHSGECEDNENMTKCMSPTGEEPCADTDPCPCDPAEEDCEAVVN